MKALDLRGRRFGRLLAQRRSARPSSTSGAFWICLCDCGKETTVTVGSLRTGSVRSCGCLWKEVMRGNKFAKKHGYHGTKIYRAYIAMMERCYNENHKFWKRYGGRGIKVCRRWHKFENFLADMGEPPPGLTLDRVNNDLGYSKNNCRWATWKEQANNKKLCSHGPDGRFI